MPSLKDIGNNFLLSHLKAGGGGDLVQISLQFGGGAEPLLRLQSRHRLEIDL